MSTQDYVSQIKHIDHDNETVFNYLSDFSNISQFINSELLEKLNGKIPRVTISDFSSDRDSCRFLVSGQEAGIAIIERQPPKLLKVGSTGSMPLNVTLWIQLLPVSPYQTKMRVTLRTEMNVMLKMMFGKKLETGIEQIADALTMLPYR
ncbi:MAG: SRPBCC family protein [Bacteroidales bacterium]|jgi:carbon monoxide dehydrogenase subunit G|nr:SRPBCC family protein [Bacteroidales bacterium]